MHSKGRFGAWRNGVAALVIMAAVAMVVAPSSIGYSTGITGTSPGAPADFREVGCTASGCHGGQAFAEGSSLISWTITDEEGNEPVGNAYEHGAHYTITITLDEQNEPGASNRAGFNLYVSAGELGAVDGSSKVSDDHMEATHVNGGSTEWQVLWTAPDEGVVVFDAFVNDVDGDRAPSDGDRVHRVGWWLTDASGAMPGAAAAEEEVHVGVPLPQYWLGLIALAGMVFVLVFGFVYLKYVSPHNADHKDR